MSAKKEALVDAAVDVLVQHGMLVQVMVQQQVPITAAKETGEGCSNTQQDEGEREPPLFTLFLLPTTSIHELKRTLQQQLGVAAKEQLLSIGDNKLLLDGCLHSSASGGEIRVNLQRIPLDPRLESLFEIVGLDSWEERDEIMAKMNMTQHPNECYQGHELASYTDTGYQPLAEYSCSRCHASICHRGIHSQPMCCDCSFYLCSSCWKSDTGSQAQPDPFQSLSDMATKIGHHMASGAPDYERSQRLLLHTADISRLKLGRAIVIHMDAPLVPRGANLVIRFNDKARRLLQTVGLEEAMEDSEIDQVCDDGVTVEGMIQYREAWVQSSTAVALADAIIDMLGEQKDAHPYPYIALVSFSHLQVIYEMGVGICIDLDDDDSIF